MTKIWTTLILCLFLGLEAKASSSLFVENGVYSRVTIQIEEQQQPENCVEYLNHLEVSKSFLFIYRGHIVLLRISEFRGLKLFEFLFDLRWFFREPFLPRFLPALSEKNILKN